PFFTTKPLGKGTGLGLSNVFSLVQRLGGSIALESEPGCGTAVRISLPVVEAAAERRMTDSTPPESRGETVLMVDDDPLVRLTVESYLHRLGYRALTATSAAEALEMCDDPALEVSLLFTDVMMPGMLGVDLMWALRRRCRRCSVLFMSAH